MLGDYKYEMQLMAEEEAEKDGKDFSKLGPNDQLAYYNRGSERWREDRFAAADSRRKLEIEDRLIRGDK